MDYEEKNKLLEQYIDNIIIQLEEKNIKVSDEKKKQVLDMYYNSDKSLDEIKKEIDQLVKQYLKNYFERQERLMQLRLENKRKKTQLQNVDKTFGEVYKSYVIHTLKMYEDIINDKSIIEENKKQIFESRLSEYLASEKTKKIGYAMQQITDFERIKKAQQEMFLGSESLNFESVSNLYNTFVNDLDIIANDSEGKMYSTILNNKEIEFDDQGNLITNIDYNFNGIKEIYDFAKEHNKQIKFHTFLWHNAIPENLRKAIDKVNDSNLKRNMALSFLKDYAFNLANFIKENGYNLSQLEVLNEIASDQNDNEVLRKSWWKDVIGKNPINAEEYFIDVLKIVREAFPNTKLLYNDYNEYLPYKCDKICQIVKYIQQIESKEGIKLLDGLGLQAHYTDYIQNMNTHLSKDMIEQTSLKYTKLGIPIYISEFDYNCIANKNNPAKDQELKKSFIDNYVTIANGFNMWGNSDKLTWGYTLDENNNYRNSHLIDANGNPKEVYYQIKQTIKGNEMDLNTYLNQKANDYLKIIYSEYGKYFNEDQINFYNQLIKSNNIVIENDDILYKQNQGNDYKNTPLAHGGRVFEDNKIHFYPFTLQNQDKENIRNECEELLIHELMHYFIRPEYMNINNEQLKEMNHNITEALVDMCARDIQVKYNLHQNYNSKYSNNVIYIREALHNILDVDQRMKIVFNGSVEEILNQTSINGYNSYNEYINTVNKNTEFNKLVQALALKIRPNEDGSMEESILLNTLANFSSKEESLRYMKKIELAREITERNIDENILQNSILLIGPMGTGKTTISKDLSTMLNMPRVSLDNREQLQQFYKDRAKFSNFKDFEFYLTSSVLTSLKEPAVIDFGAGHSVYEDQIMFNEIKKVISKFSNVEFIIPSENKEESIQVLNQRIQERNKIVSNHVLQDNQHFVNSPCNSLLATDVVYTNGKTITEVEDKIIDNVSSKENNKKQDTSLLVDKPKKRVLKPSTPNNGDTTSTNKGYINVFILTLITGFVMGIVATLSYMFISK